jgi:uncharacterized protein (TIGR03066 family)
MAWQRSLLLACFAAGLLGYAAAAADDADKDKAPDKAKIVGTWVLVKADSKNTPPPGTVVEFTKDGKMTITVTVEEKKLTLNGSYSIEGDKLKTKVTTPDGQESRDTDTITKLTDKELSLKDTKGQKTEFKKK